MNAPDRRTLARLLANAGGDWGKLLRDFETTPQPKRGRPSRGAKSIDDYTGIRRQQHGGGMMNKRDRRTLARLLKYADGEWDKLRRDFGAMPQPKRGRPSGGAKPLDKYLVVTLKRYCEISRCQEGTQAARGSQVAREPSIRRRRRKGLWR